MRAVVFANGVLNKMIVLHPEDLLIAADGGARHCLDQGLTPAAVIGDMDSLSEADVSTLKAAGAEVIHYPIHKDFTDLELALYYARDRGADEILVLGALGRRWDQTLANLLLPATAALESVRISLVDGPQQIFLVRPEEPRQVSGRPGDTVSLVPLGGDAHGISTQGLEYPLDQGSLVFGSTRGISNVLQGEAARVSLKEGVLMCVVIHQAVE